MFPGMNEEDRRIQRTNVLIALANAWKRHSEWRLGQLISNALGPGPQDVFFPTDERWLELLHDI